ncbi:hypothetical protein KQH40_01380 [bacterium]|nr:hypothetical protein [bacterium]
MTVKIQFKITLESDYHIGAGYGGGPLIDSALFRNQDGLPIIRGTTLAGLLKDGLWRLLQSPLLQNERKCKNAGLVDSSFEYCGEGLGAQDSLCPLCLIFGTPAQKKFWRFSTARPANDEVVADSQIVQNVRINPQTGRAATAQLFSREESQPLEFLFTAESIGADDNTLGQAALLAAAARNVRALGRGRSRGSGACTISIENVEGLAIQAPVANWQEYLMETFSAYWLDGDRESDTSVEVRAFSLPEWDENGEAVCVQLVARLDEPLIISRNAEAGNNYNSAEYILGQTLRGAFAWRTISNGFHVDGNEENSKIFNRIFLRGGARFGNLYPAFVNRRSETLYPSVPMPRDAVTCKVFPGREPVGHGVWFGTQGNIFECPKCGSPLQNLKGFSILNNSDNVKYNPEFLNGFSPMSHIEMHPRIDPHTGRVREGDLFGYKVLDEGQFFVGEMIFAHPSAWETFKVLAGVVEHQPYSLQLGKANEKGYGKTTCWFEIKESLFANSIGDRFTEGESTTEFTMTFLSDVILQDPWGRYYSGFDSTWLADLLDLEEDQVQSVENAAFSRRHAVEGFNAKLGLPRWRDIAIAAGSTAVVHTGKPILIDQLRAIEANGVGLRKAEGFGRIVFNSPYQRDSVFNRFITIGENLPSKPEHLHQSEMRDWQEKLDDQNWKNCNHQAFIGVARWLYTNRTKSIQILISGMKNMGNQMPADIGQRMKDSQFEKDLGQGVELLIKMLEAIDSCSQEQQPEMVSMLADTLAANIRDEGGR